jgi:hypothetical protein
VPLNLKGIQRFAEGEMVDEIIITRDPEGSKDDVFNPVTGQYVSHAGDINQIYHGPGLVIQPSVFPSQAVEAGATTLNLDFELHIPLHSTKVLPDDRIVVLRCMRDPHLVGQEFWVRAPGSSTFSVTQQLRIYRKDTRVIL